MKLSVIAQNGVQHVVLSVDAFSVRGHCLKKFWIVKPVSAHEHFT